jgi:ATP-binding cassette subfamily C protein
MSRKGIVVMGKLIGLIKPLLHIMLLAILLGIAGNLSAMAITILGGHGILKILNPDYGIALSTIFILLFICALLRGVLRYGEQACNHYIAFKLLAFIRHQVFAVLRRLAPAKLEGKEKGNLIALLTSDIELLEVFYAHTISPIAIGVVTSAIVSGYLATYHVLYGVLAIVSYIVIGGVFPIIISKAGREKGLIYRNSIGAMNSFLLDSLRGLTEVLQYQAGEKRRSELREKTSELEEKQWEFKRLENLTRVMNDVGVIVFSLLTLLLGSWLFEKGTVGFEGVFIPFVTIIGSFGPVIALSNLSNNLMHTLASGNRVLDLLEETPVVTEVTDKEDVIFEGAACTDVLFGYGDKQILKGFSAEFEKHKILGIHGKNGCGKSTLLKLLMRFYDVSKGAVTISKHNIRDINTDNLRKLEGYVTQETHIFNTTIAENIGIAREGAAREEIIKAAKKASLHEFIMSLPDGYDTVTGELGDKLSGGERQRIGIAREFLHNAPFLLLDEPTSNLDSLNEGIILKALVDESQDKTVILVSHRESTMNIAERVLQM